MKKKIGLMLLGVMVVSQVSAFAYTTIQHGSRATVYGNVSAYDSLHIVYTDYNLTNRNANGLAKLTEV